MALGSDARLGGQQPYRQTFAPKPAAPSQGRTVRYSGAPQANDGAMADFKNNRMAQAAGAAQDAIREMDRAGVSRGKGQRYAAEVAEADADAGARGDVAKMEMGVAQQNAMARQSFENMKKNERLNTEGLLEQLRTSERSERMARQGWGQDLYEAVRRGQFNLDQMNLDMSPLWQRLFS